MQTIPTTFDFPQPKVNPTTINKSIYQKILNKMKSTDKKTFFLISNPKHDPKIKLISKINLFEPVELELRHQILKSEIVVCILKR